MTQVLLPSGSTKASLNSRVLSLVLKSSTGLTASEGVLYSHNLWGHEVKDGYESDKSCSFYIESEPGTKIRLYLESFHTECSYDYLHIHDGSSPFNRTMGLFA
eukprot:sb/3478174/